MKKLIVLLSMAALGLASCAKKMSEEQLYAEAQNLEKQEKVDSLITIYEEFVDRFPKSEKADQALYRLALIYQNNKQDFKTAVAAHERLIKDYPQSRFVSQSHFMAAFIYANDLKDLEKARARYATFLEAFPQHELVPSVQWELKHLGQDISQIDLFSKLGEPQKKAPLAQVNGVAKKPIKP